MWGVRSAWLGRPWFFLAIVVLALNDHVFKESSPGWLTGKLSDFAGLIVIGTLLSVVAGPTWGVVLAGCGFSALKSLPGVAEAASPLLGGVTLRDPTDLIALSVLPVLWWHLHHLHPDQPVRDRRAWQAIGLVTAVLATTATSAPEPRYLELGAAPGAILASVDPGDGVPRAYLSSPDGGLTWSRIAQSRAESTQASWGYGPEDQTCEAGVVCYYGWSEQDLEVCADDGVCYQVREDDAGSSIIERRAPRSAWQADGVINQPITQLAIDPFHSDHVAVAWEGEPTVICRSGAGAWVSVDLTPLAATELERLGGQFYTAAGTPGGSIVTFLIVLVLALGLAPRLGARIALPLIGAMICLLGISLGWFLGFMPALNLGWLLFVCLLTFGMRISYRAEQRAAAKAAAAAAEPPTPDLR